MKKVNLILPRDQMVRETFDLVEGSLSTWVTPLSLNLSYHCAKFDAEKIVEIEI